MKGAAYIESALKSSDIGICYESLSARNADTEPLWSGMKPPLVAKLPLEASHELRTRTNGHDHHCMLSDRRSQASELFLVHECGAFTDEAYEVHTQGNRTAVGPF